MPQRTQLSKEDWAKLMTTIHPLTASFDKLSDHVVITDPHGNIVYANKAVEEHTGYSIDDILTKNPGDLWGGNMPEEVYQDMWDTIKNKKQPWVGDIKNVQKDGTEYWQQLRITPVFDDNGEILCYIGMEPDVTERKQAEATTDTRMKQLEMVDRIFAYRELKMQELLKELEELRTQRG